MKIRIKSKTKTTFIVYLYDEIWGVLPMKTLQNFFSVEEGSLSVDNTIKNEIQAEIEKYAWKRLLDFIAYRERSKGEADRFLMRLPLDTTISNKLIKKAQSYNYLNDERFTEIFIEDMIAKGKSRTEIKSKLYHAGINGSMVKRLLSKNYTLEIKNQILHQVVEKAWRRFGSHSPKERFIKIMNYLVRKGYSAEDVRHHLNVRNENE